MGRPERALDPDSGPVQRFAHDMRQLRGDAGWPTYRALALRANYSASVLSRAASGRELPSLAVTLAYVSACGGDEEEWETRWRALELAQRARPAAAPALTTDPHVLQAAGQRRRVFLISFRTLIAAVAITVGLVIVPAGLEAIYEKVTKAAAVGDGASPVTAGCLADGRNIAKVPVVTPEPLAWKGMRLARGTRIGQLDLTYSARCDAEFARITLDNFSEPMPARGTVTVSRPADGISAFSPFDHLGLVYSSVLHADGSCVYAYAALTIVGRYQVSARTTCS